MFWNKKIETMKPEELKTLQLKRLKKTLSLVQNVEFYRNLLAGAGLKASSIKTLDDIQKIPFKKKQDLRNGYPFGFFAVPMKKIVRIHTTSGTTGKPTVVGYTRSDLDTWSDLIARNMTMVGVGENDIFQNMVNYGMFTGGLGFHYGAEPWSESVRHSLEKKLDLTAYDSYGLSELFGPGVAFECPERNGLHIWHDSFLVETIDPKTGEQ